MNWTIRAATLEDVSELRSLIPLSVHALQFFCYSELQREAALGPVFAVDRQLILDGTYFAVVHEGVIIGCGGWSKRASLFGGDAGRGKVDPELNPDRDPARIRAFFVHPDWARRGIGKALLAECETAIIRAGFKEIELSATLAGVPLYLAGGYREVSRGDVPLQNGLVLPTVKMFKQLEAPTNHAHR
jgi:GNAT superfamily N-acetyltransferase